MDTTSGILIGRPFGGIGILCRKSIGAYIQVHKYNTRVMGIEFDNGNRKLLAVNIYICLMTTGLGTAKIMTNLWVTWGWFILLSKRVTFLVSM